jgi:hypothetical protein
MARIGTSDISIGTVLAVVVILLAVVFAAIGKMDIWVAALFILTGIAILIP